MAQTALIVNEAARPQGQTPQATEVVAFASTPSGLVIPERGGHLDDLAALLAWLQKKRKKNKKTNAGRQPAMYQCFELLTLDGIDVTTSRHHSSAHVFTAETPPNSQESAALFSEDWWQNDFL